MEWLIAHFDQIAKLIGELTAAIGGLTVAIIGLASIVSKMIPILSKDHPGLPLVKFIGNVALNTPAIKDSDRPDPTPPASPVGPAAAALLLFCLLASPAMADLTGTQAVIYLNKDHTVAQATVFEVIKSKPIDSLGKWNILIDGWSLDVGGAYDDTKVLKNGTFLIGKNLGNLSQYLPITFPLSDKLVIKAYVTGGYVEDIWTSPKIQLTEGVGYISATLKF